MALLYDEINLWNKGKFWSSDKQSEKVTKFVCSAGCKTVGSMYFSPMGAKLVCPAVCNAAADYMGGKEMTITDRTYQFFTDITATATKEALFFHKIFDKASAIPHALGLSVSAFAEYVKQPIIDKTSPIFESVKVSYDELTESISSYTAKFDDYNSLDSVGVVYLALLVSDF